MENVEKTIISQYANSRSILQLITNMNQYIDQSANFQAFYDFVWNVDTAQGFGLDIWGEIVGVGRYLQIPGQEKYFGFDDGVGDYAPFGSAPFYVEDAETETYRLADDAYRVLILAKAMSNIIATNSKAINQLLQNLFPGRGRCYVLDLGNMTMRYIFEFTLAPYEKAIVNTSGVLPHGAGVQIEVLEIPYPDVFGFAEAGVTSAPFDQGVFLNS